MSLIITSLQYSYHPCHAMPCTYENSILIPQMSIKAIIIVVLIIVVLLIVVLKVSLVIDNRVKVIISLAK